MHAPQYCQMHDVQSETLLSIESSVQAHMAFVMTPVFEEAFEVCEA